MSEFNELDVLNSKGKKERLSKSDLKKRIKELEEMNKSLKEENEILKKKNEELRKEITIIRENELKTKKSRRTSFIDGIEYYTTNAFLDKSVYERGDIFIKKDDFDKMGIGKKINYYFYYDVNHRILERNNAVKINDYQILLYEEEVIIDIRIGDLSNKYRIKNNHKDKISNISHNSNQLLI